MKAFKIIVSILMFLFFLAVMFLDENFGPKPTPEGHRGKTRAEMNSPP